MELKVTKISKRTLPTYFTIGLLTMALYYLSFRYPFQINSTTTSPTYIDTPLILKALKYGLFIVWVYLYALLFFMLRTYTQSITKKDMLFLVASSIISIFPLVTFLISKEIFLFQTGLFFVATIFYSLYQEKYINLSKLSKIVSFFILAAIVFEGYQLINYYVAGRLPALAYENSISVRFGSIWDDPNGFALLIPLLLSFSMVKCKKLVNKIVLAAVFMFMLIFTQSLTGTISTLASMLIGITLIYLSTSSKKTFTKTVWLMASYLLGLVVFLKFILPLPTIQRFIYLKSGSIEGHLNIIDLLKDASFMDLLGLNPYGMYGESGYINLLLNFGVFYTLVYLIVGFCTVLVLLNKIKTYRGEKGVEIYYGAFFFAIAYMIALSNLPVDTIFPLNLIYVICIIIAMSKPLELEVVGIKSKKRFFPKITL